MPKFVKEVVVKQEIDLDISLDDIVMLVMAAGTVSITKLGEIGAGGFYRRWSAIDEKLMKNNLYPETYKKYRES